MKMRVTELTRSISSQPLDSLQVVVIDSFYDAVDRDEAIEWLGALFRFKVNSYRESYPYGILPIGESDLVGTQWVLAQKNGSHLVPIMGFKTVDSMRTDVFRMKFPAFSAVEGQGLELHRAAIERELNKAHSEGYGLGFLGGWTAEPGLRNNPVIANLYRKASSALFAHWLHYFNIQAGVTFASLRFHVEKMHAYLGMKRLADADGKPLSDFRARSSFDEPACASVIYRENLSKESLQDSIDLMDLWEKRIVIASDRSPLQHAEKSIRRAA